MKHTTFHLPPGAASLAAIVLCGCSMFGIGEKSDKPAPPPKPVTLVNAAGSTVSVGDDQTGSPVDVRIDQQLVVRLRLEGTTGAEWVLADFQPGVLAAPAPSQFDRDLTQAVYGLQAGTQVWRFKPAQPGQVALKFELRIPHSRDGAVQTASYAVTVR